MTTHNEHELPDAEQGDQANTDISENLETTGPENDQIQYHGRWQDVLKLSCWNALWTILTLGIFRFWAKTRMRRYIWSNIVVDGDALEYTGRGLELFLGFVIVSVIFIPVIAAATFVSTQLPPHLMFIPELVLYLAIFFLVFVAIYRATRYRYSRTFWRGIRARLGGSALKYGLIGFGSSVLGLVTFGILIPYNFVVTTRYETENTWIGDTKARFTGRLGPVLRKWLLSWFLCLAVLAITTAIAVVSQSRWMILLGIVPYLAIIAIMIRYRVWLFRYQAENTEMGGLRFASTLTTAQYVKILLRFLLVTVVIGAVFFALLALTGGLTFFSLLKSGSIGQMAPGQVATVAIPLIILVLIASPVFKIASFVAMTHPMLAVQVASLCHDGDVSELHANPDANTVPRTGEGLAEAFDLGGI